MVANIDLSWQGTKIKAVYTGGAGPVCECMGLCLLKGSVESGGVDIGAAKFFIRLPVLKLTNQK